MGIFREAAMAVAIMASFAEAADERYWTALNAAARERMRSSSCICSFISSAVNSSICFFWNSRCNSSSRVIYSGSCGSKVCCISRWVGSETRTMGHSPLTSAARIMSETSFRS